MMATCQREGCESVLTGRQRAWCSDGCRKRAHEQARRAMCPNCGDPMGVGSGYPKEPPKQCRKCTDADRAEAHERHVQEVARLYNLGLTVKEIALELGFGPSSSPPAMTEAHRRGLISYRHTRTRVEAASEARWGE
jgi:DNA-binding CsgD family transcriptional regulator